MDDILMLAILGWGAAIMFLILLVMTLNKLDDYRNDSYVLRKLQDRYPDSFKDSGEP